MDRVTRNQAILDLLSEGWSRREVAGKLGVSVSTVKRVVAAARAAKESPKPTASAGDPRTRLEALRNGFLAAAEFQMEKLAELAEKGKGSSQRLIQAKIATQGAIEAQQHLDRSYDLPDELPDDDEEARRLVLNGWWLAASRGGSSTAMTKLAGAYGIKTAARQPVRIVFERPTPTDEGSEAPAAPAVPGEGSRLN